MSPDPVDGWDEATPELFDLSGRAALVVGGAGLIGPQLARALRDHGARVLLADRDAKRAESAVRAIEAERGGPPCESAVIDVTDAASVRACVQVLIDSHGAIDVLVNCAAFTTRTRSEGYYAPFEDYDSDEWRRVLDVNLTGTFLCCREVGRAMAARGSGSIVNIASTYGVVSPDQRMYDGMEVGQPAPYSVSKAGVLGLTRYLATYWGEQGVRVNAITPGGVFDEHDPEFARRYGERTPMGRMARPTELRGAVVYLASDASSYCTGHNLVVDGGWTVW